MLTENEEWFIKLIGKDRRDFVLRNWEDEIDDEREKTKDPKWLACLDIAKAGLQEARSI